MVAMPLLSFFIVPPAQAVFGAEDIYFEYGAESGVLQPPWDSVSGSGIITVDDTHARTGSYSVKMYQKAPPKTDQERRGHMREYGTSHGRTEGYASYWVYMDSQVAEPNNDWGPTWGGWQTWFGPTWKTYYWWTGMRFGSAGSPNNKGIQVSWGFGKIGEGVNFDEDAEAVEQAWDLRLVDDKYYYSNMIGSWHHFQLYYKIATGTSGIVRAWINNTLVAEKTGFATDPRAYDSWNNNPEDGTQCVFRSANSPNGAPNLGPDLYQGTSSYENWAWYDDFVFADEKVSESYGVGEISSEFESWEDGFESGDFIEWNSTDYSGGGVAPSVTSTYSYTGTYSANFTANGADGSTANAMHLIQGTDEVYQRSYVRFEDLPDTNNTRLMVLRMGSSANSFIVSAGVFNMSSNVYWCIDLLGNSANPPENYTQATINADQWYLMELYYNATTNGNAILWINNVLQGQTTGDYSAYDLERVYPYIYVEDAQVSAKTVYHDNYRVDNVRIGGGTPKIIQVVEDEEGEEEDGGESGATTFITPLPNIMINGSYLTDSSGYYEFTNLTYNQVYTFVVEAPASYYPAWCLNVEGSYSWNGTHYILNHNVTEEQTGYIQIYFFSTSQPYINYTDAKLTSASMSSSVLYFTGDDSGAKNIEVYSATQPTYVMGKPYNSSTDYAGTTFNMSYTFSGAKTFALSWQNFGGVIINATTGELTKLPTYQNQMLKFYVMDTGTSITTIYASDKGEPYGIIGEQTWSYNDTTKMVRVAVAHSSEEEVEVSWAREKWLFTFKGLYDEDSGSYLSSVDVTVYYVNLTSTTFTVNGTHYFSSEHEPLYFLFTLTSYNREYWIHTGENDTTIYILNASTSVYTFAFLDLAKALEHPYVEAKYYVNETLQTVEKRKVGMENKIQMSLVEGKKYSIVIRGNATHTYGDLLMTSTTTVQLLIKGIKLPEDILPISEKVWIYGNRTFDSPNGSISIAYQDELNQTNSVKIYVNYKNGTNAYNGTETASSFIHTWSSALNNTDYTVVAIVDHTQYGITTWKQPLPYRILGTPSSTSFFGTIVQFVTSIIISSCIILAIVVRTGVLKRDMFMHAHLTSSMSRSLMHAQIKKTLVWAVAHHLFFSTQS